MTFYYIMRDVQPGSVCSHRVGRTYIDEVYRCSDEADRRAEQLNRFCHTPGVHYTALAHDDTTCLPYDHFDPKRAPTYERVFIN